jgi:hypothetical protein
VIAAIAICAWLIFFFYRRRARNNNYNTPANDPFVYPDPNSLGTYVDDTNGHGLGNEKQMALTHPPGVEIPRGVSNT